MDNLKRAPMDNTTVILKRTFNMSMPESLAREIDPQGPAGKVRYWRVIGPRHHRNYESDLSIEGLKEWGIL